MRLNNEFKRTTDREFREGDYILGKVFSRGVIIAVLLVIVCGVIGFGYKRFAVEADFKALNCLYRKCSTISCRSVSGVQ